MRLLHHRLRTVSDSLARPGHVAFALLLRSLRRLISRLHPVHSGTHAVALSIIRRLSRRTRHLTIAPVSVLVWTAPGWILRLLATIAGIAAIRVAAIGVLSVVPIRAVAVAMATIAAIVAGLRALALVGLVVTR